MNYRHHRGLVTQKTKVTEDACVILKSALDRFVQTQEDKAVFLTACVNLLKRFVRSIGVFVRIRGCQGVVVFGVTFFLVGFVTFSSPTASRKTPSSSSGSFIVLLPGLPPATFEICLCCLR